MNSKNSIFLLVLLLLLSSCTAAKLKKILGEGPDAYSAYVLIVPVGEDVIVWKGASEQFKDCFAAPPYVLKDYPNVYPVNSYFPSDSCMVAFKKAGLIEYDIKSEDEDKYLCDVRLTQNGRQYLLERYISDFENQMETVDYLVVAYSKIDNVSHIKAYRKGRGRHRVESYDCISDIRLYATPFAECIGADVSRRALNKIHDVQEWEIRYSSVVPGEPRYFTDKLPKDDLNNDYICYDLDCYTKEEALRDYLKFCLSDTLAEVKSMRISKYGYFKYKTWEDVPDDIKELCLAKDKDNILGDYYCHFLAGTRKLGEILHDQKIDQYVNIAGTDMGYQQYREFTYTVNADYTKYGASCYECDENPQWYGKVLYVLYRNKIYFNRDVNIFHYWFKEPSLHIDYSDVKSSADLKAPRPFESTVPVEHVKHLL